MDVQTKTNESITSISCPSCGAGAAYGQAGCGFCGSGLLKNVETIQGKFGIPNNSKEWKVGVEFGESDNLDKIVAGMEKITPEGEYSFVMWKTLPVIVGSGIDSKKAIENYFELGKQIEREKLGTKWTGALDELHKLQVDLHSLGDEGRLGLKSKYRSSLPSGAMIASDEFNFFSEPTFKNFESFIESDLKVGDDADSIKYGVKTIRDLMAVSPGQ